MRVAIGMILAAAVLAVAVVSAQNGRKVSGVVITAANQRPVANARVRYEEEGGGSPQETVTDDKGRFEFSNGRSGVVTVSARRFGTARRSWPPRTGRELRIALVPPARVEGTVADIVTGRPVDGKVALLVQHPHNVVSEGAAVQGGAFRIDDLPPGPMLVLARADGFAPYFATTTAEAGRVRDLRIRLFLEGTVSGHVQDASGSVVEGARVTLGYLTATPGRGLLASVVGGQPISGSDGSFSLEGLVPDARIGLRAERNGRRSDVVTTTVGPGMVRQGIVLRLR